MWLTVLLQPLASPLRAHLHPHGEGTKSCLEPRKNIRTLWKTHVLHGLRIRHLPRIVGTSPQPRSQGARIPGGVLRVRCRSGHPKRAPVRRRAGSLRSRERIFHVQKKPGGRHSLGSRGCRRSSSGSSARWRPTKRDRNHGEFLLPTARREAWRRAPRRTSNSPTGKFSRNVPEKGRQRRKSSRVSSGRNGRKPSGRPTPSTG